MTLASPLQWPVGWKRHPHRGRSPFRVSLAKARDDLYTELERFGATSVVVQQQCQTQPRRHDFRATELGLRS